MKLYKTVYCWWPIRLAQHIKNSPPDKPNMRFIGWAWMQRAKVVNNFNHGWVAFIDCHCDYKEIE